ncbi:hypothetical protein KIW84_013804 [Lathyrus oleraceus]|uniref:Uncharacterized protein n=1 Tax=Pisum sativum TaxID=3888 RepID=A0A9D5BLF0_PEA|nr:hypothetical protein KIW84_013804 [Pisum sativum]
MLDYLTRLGVLELIEKEKEHAPVGYVKMYFKSLLSIEIQIPLSKYLKQKNKNRASKFGGCNYAAGNINVAEITQRMRDELGRPLLLNEIPLETHIKKNVVDERSKNTQEEYDRQLAPTLSEYPEKRKNGRAYGAGGYAKTIKRRDKSFLMRLANGEGTSHPPILTVDMLEIVRNLAHIEATREATIRNA